MLVTHILVNGLVSGSIRMLITVGFTLVFGVLHVVNLAHGELYMLGAFAVWYLFQISGANYWVSIAVAMLIVAISPGWKGRQGTSFSAYSGMKSFAVRERMGTSQIDLLKPFC